MLSPILTISAPLTGFDGFLDCVLSAGPTWAAAREIEASHHVHAGEVRFLLSLPSAERVVRETPIMPATAVPLARIARAIKETEDSRAAEKCSFADEPSEPRQAHVGGRR